MATMPTIVKSAMTISSRPIVDAAWSSSCTSSTGSDTEYDCVCMGVSAEITHSTVTARPRRASSDQTRSAM
jgi:hypothetical protein